jgi:hypothetical protein
MLHWERKKGGSQSASERFCANDRRMNATEWVIVLSEKDAKGKEKGGAFIKGGKGEVKNDRAAFWVAAATLPYQSSLCAQGKYANLGEFDKRTEGVDSVKSKRLYQLLLSDYKPGIVLDYCMKTGICGEVALEQGWSFVGVEITPKNFEDAKARFEHLVQVRAISSASKSLQDKRPFVSQCIRVFLMSTLR